MNNLDYNTKQIMNNLDDITKQLEELRDAEFIVDGEDYCTLTEGIDEIKRLRAALREIATPDKGYEAWRIRVAREALGDE